MPICPNCEYEYKEGVTVCPDCGQDLISKSDFDEGLINPEDWEILLTCSEEYEADMLKANLEGAGIQSLIIPQKDRNFPSVGDFSIIKLAVKKEDLESAKQILDDINKGNNQEETEE